MPRSLLHEVEDAGGVLSLLDVYPDEAKELLEVMIMYEDEAIEIISKYGDEAFEKMKEGLNVEDIDELLSGISKADRAKLNSWKYILSDELYLKYKDVFDNPKYYDQSTGEIHWPENDGFLRRIK